MSGQAAIHNSSSGSDKPSSGQDQGSGTTDNKPQDKSQVPTVAPSPTTGPPASNGDDQDKQKKGRPERNTDQNKRVSDAAREANLSAEQRRLLGRIVERDSRAGGENYTYQDIKAIADEIKAGRSSY